MKLKAALVAVTLAFAPLSHGAMVDPAEPPKTPAGGAPQAGLTAAQIAGIAIGAIVLIAVVAGDDDDNGTTSTATATGTGTN